MTSMTHHGTNLKPATGVAAASSQSVVMTASTPSLQSKAGNSGGGRRIAWLLGSTAAAYYLSILIHVVGYGIAAALFVLWGHHLVESHDTDVTPLRASLDERQEEDDQPVFEPIVEIGISDQKAGSSSIQQISNHLKVSADGLIETLNNEALPAAPLSDKDNDTDGGGFLFKLPESGLAVTKGSFTAWTNPERPQPGQDYLIIIEIRLKESVSKYRVNDLRGTVIGTDDYRQRIPFDTRTPNSSFYTDEHATMQKLTGSEVIKVRANKVQLVIRVPGGRRLVKDTIQIRSRRLKEQQRLELVFDNKPEAAE